MHPPLSASMLQPTASLLMPSPLQQLQQLDILQQQQQQMLQQHQQLQQQQMQQLLMQQQAALQQQAMGMGSFMVPTNPQLPAQLPFMHAVPQQASLAAQAQMFAASM